MEKITFAPHADIELGTDRSPIDIFLTLPEGGVNEKTGIILMITGFEDIPTSGYQQNVLCPHLANAYNCITAGVSYFGIFRDGYMRIPLSFINNMNRIYDANLTQEDFSNVREPLDFYQIVADKVLSRGVANLDLRCQPLLVTGRNEYQSWGFLPALDCLRAVWEVIKRYPEVDTKKIIAYGVNYGGYIALLLGKYAPHTFSVVLDKNGYTRAVLKHIVCGEVMEADYEAVLDIGDSERKLRVGWGFNNPWTIENERSPSYFSDSHRSIRSLMVQEHFRASETRYFIYHEDSAAAPIEDKDEFVGMLERIGSVVYKRVPDKNAVDNDLKRRIDKKIGQDDLRLFDYMCRERKMQLEKPSADTDFSLKSRHVFDCGSRSYVFQYGGEQGVTVELVPNREQVRDVKKDGGVQ